MAPKSNRTLALSEKDKQEGKFIRVDSLLLSETEPVQAWLQVIYFPILIHRQVFTNQDRILDILYLACSDLTCNTSDIEAIYQKRWTVEVFHKTLKSNTELAKSPTKSTRTQINHIFISIYAAFQLECLSLKHKMNHFSL